MLASFIYVLELIEQIKSTDIISLDIIRISFIFIMIILIMPVFTIILIYTIYFNTLENNQNRVELLLGYSPTKIILSQINTLYICVIIMFLVPYISIYIILFIIPFFNNKLLFLFNNAMVFDIILTCILCLLYHFFIVNSFINILILFNKNIFKGIISIVISLALFFYIFYFIYWDFLYKYLMEKDTKLSVVIGYFIIFSFINIIIYFRIIVNFKNIEFNK